VKTKLNTLTPKIASNEASLKQHSLRSEIELSNDTALTRMIKGGISASEVGKIADHTQPKTTYR
jgi:hypothetical protein